MAWFEKLELAYSNFIGVEDTVSTNTGTAALHLALEGKHYPPGSEIIVPEFTMIATALAVYYARCQPVFVDCLDDMNINAAQIESKISEKTVAIIITHIYGRVCSIAPIAELCKNYEIDLIEDCAEIHGANYHDGVKHGSKVGSLGIGCFSFYRNKIVHAEEGGAITVSGDHLYAQTLRDLKNMSFGSIHNYIHEQIGFNYRMPDGQAKMAYESLAQVESNLQNRKQIETWYDHYLDEKHIRSNRDVVWVYDINHASPQTLVKHLNQHGIQARHTFAPMSMQPCFGIKKGFESLEAYKLYRSTCYLPVTETITEADIKKTAELVNTF